MLTAKAGSFVNVIASINHVKQVGKILYVNPTFMTTAPDAAAAGGALAATPFDAFRLSVRDASDHELLVMRPTIQIARCEGELPESALVHQDVPLIAGMKAIVLLHDDVEVARFDAGPAPMGAGAAAGMTSLTAGPPHEAKPHRLPLNVGSTSPSQPGLSYTVQVRPQGSLAWQTIAVGHPQPNLDLDRNQFPGVSSATVRVLRTNGFEDEVVAEQDVDLAQ